MAFLAFLENISPSWRNLTSPESFLLVLRTQIWHVLETRAYYEKPREITNKGTCVVFKKGIIYRKILLFSDANVELSFAFLCSSSSLVNTISTIICSCKDDHKHKHQLVLQSTHLIGHQS